MWLCIATGGVTLICQVRWPVHCSLPALPLLMLLHVMVARSAMLAVWQPLRRHKGVPGHDLHGRAPLLRL